MSNNDLSFDDVNLLDDDDDDDQLGPLPEIGDYDTDFLTELNDDLSPELLPDNNSDNLDIELIGIENAQAQSQGSLNENEDELLDDFDFEDIDLDSSDVDLDGGFDISFDDLDDDGHTSIFTPTASAKDLNHAIALRDFITASQLSYVNAFTSYEKNPLTDILDNCSPTSRIIIKEIVKFDNLAALTEEIIVRTFTSIGHKYYADAQGKITAFHMKAEASQDSGIQDRLTELTNESDFYKGLSNQTSIEELNTYLQPSISEVEQHKNVYRDVLSDLKNIQLLSREGRIAPSETELGLKIEQAMLTEQASLKLTPDNCTFPSEILFSGGKQHVTCSCGERHEEEGLLFTFQLIRLDHTDTTPIWDELGARLNEEHGILKQELTAPLDEIIPDASEDNFTTRILEKLAGAVDKTGRADRNTNILSKVYTMGVSFPVPLCSCGKYIILPEKFMRYLIAFHVHSVAYTQYTRRPNKDEFVIQNSPLIYKDDVITEALNKFMSAGLEYAKQQSETAYRPEVFPGTREDFYNSLITAYGPTIRHEEQIITVEKSTLQESYQNVMNKFKLYSIRFKDNSSSLELRNYPISEAVEEGRDKMSREEVASRTITYNLSRDLVLEALLAIVSQTRNLVTTDLSPENIIAGVFEGTSEYYAQTNQAPNKIQDTLLARELYTKLNLQLHLLSQYCRSHDDKLWTTFTTDSGLGSVTPKDISIIVSSIILLLKNPLLEDFNLPDSIFSELKQLQINLDDNTLTNDYDPYSLLDAIDKALVSFRVSFLDDWKETLNFKREEFQVVAYFVPTTKKIVIDNEMPWKYWYKIGLLALLRLVDSPILKSLYNVKKAGKIYTNLQSAIAVPCRYFSSNGETPTQKSRGTIWDKIPNQLRKEYHNPVHTTILHEVLAITPVPMDLNIDWVLKVMQCNSIEQAERAVSILPIDIDLVSNNPPEPYEIVASCIEWLDMYIPDALRDYLPDYIKSDSEEAKVL